MRKIETLDEIHGLELQILVAFDEYCSSHNLRYSLGAGTLLGAVRHKGFIPWDDDIDVFMMREDYNTLLRLADTERVISGRYKIKSPSDDDMPYPFVKIIDTNTTVIERGKKTDLGLWIDIFPVDFCGNSKKSAERERRRLGYLSKFLYCYVVDAWETTRTLKSLLKRWLVTYVPQSCFKNKIIYRPRLGETAYAGTIVNSFTERDVYPSDFFTSGYTELEFENRRFPVFRRYMDILSWRYGDFMRLPKEEERIPHIAEVYVHEERNSGDRRHEL